jgi:hypothetical protein
MTKRLAIMQPYFLPYMGYWQLINDVDEFIVYDTIKYTKKGWINRNRFHLNGVDKLFSLPLKNDSDSLFVKDRTLATDFDRSKLIRQLGNAYAGAPYFKQHFPLIEDIINHPDQNLFGYIFNSIQKICDFLDIKTPLIISSDIPSDHENAKGQDKVINLCHARYATDYINPIGGLNLYDKQIFKHEHINLSFIRARVLDYTYENNAQCLPHLSIVDVMMHCPRDKILSYRTWFERE